MDTISTAEVTNVQRFLEAVRKRVRVREAFVYGSYARGDQKEWSDIDLAVVSPDFSSDLFEERIALMILAAQIDDRIEPHPFRPEDFDEQDPLVDEIRRSGLRVA
jgi:uncharacterized protein